MAQELIIIKKSKTVTDFLRKNNDRYYSGKEISEAIDVGVNSVRRHLRRLFRWNLVKCEEVHFKYVNKEGKLINARVCRVWKLKDKQ